MSDQGSVNPVFNTALSEMRSEFLAIVIDNWLNVNDETKANLKSMGNLFFAKCIYWLILLLSVTSV